MDLAVEALMQTGRQIAVILGPIAALSVTLYQVDRILTNRIFTRLGWKGLLATAWLGVPVHELSHAIACKIFGHRIEKLSLFSPDRTTGKLGSVSHAWNKRNLYQQAGRFFIGLAPLAGGSAVLWLVAKSLGPPEAIHPALLPGADLGTIVASLGDQFEHLARMLTRPEVLASERTWIFLYLCLCVGAHLAPSPADLKGSFPGFLLLVLLVFGANLFALGTETSTLSAEAAALSVAAIALQGLCLSLILCTISALLVYLVTLPLPQRS